MAAGDTDVSICSNALVLLGSSRLASFSDGTVAARLSEDLYPKIKELTQSMYPWSFTLAKVQLNRLVATPTSIWRYQYSLPADMLNGVPRRVFASGNVGASAIQNYEIQGDKLLTDETTIFVDYQVDVAEDKMPGYFVQLLIYQMAWHLAEPVTDQTTKADYWRGIALGTAADNYRGGYFRSAANIDSAGQSPTVIADYMLTAVR